MKVIVDSWAWIDKASLSELQLSRLRTNLTVVPRKAPEYPGEDPGPLYLYTETPELFGVAREYFLTNRKPHHEFVLNVANGDKSTWPGDLKFVGKLREEQGRAVAEISQRFKHGGLLGGMLKAAPGWGKCLKIGTRVLLFDGRSLPVEDVKEDDLLMGPDSKPRRVLSTTRGVGPLFEIASKHGQPWVCNDVHVLTLVHSVTNEVLDIDLPTYLRLPAWKKHHLKQFSPPEGVEFPVSPEARLLDPYFLGVWLGDGTKALNGVAVSKPDAEIEQLCKDVAAEYGLRVRTEVGHTCPTHHIVGDGRKNPLLDIMRSELGDASTVPLKYLNAPRGCRQRLLAGWLDADGHSNNGCYQIVQKRIAYAGAIAYLALSLGIRASVKPKDVDGERYWRIQLAGDFSQLPMRILRKLPRKRLQKKVATRVGFKVRSLGEGEYAGFTLDGDGRFLLGDFTVTHNTVASSALIAEMQVPTLVVVHKEFLMAQWRERLTSFLPGVRLGLVQQDECTYLGCHVVMAMVHTLANKTFPEHFMRWPGLVITDECFPAGTEIETADGPRDIASLSVGTEVLCAVGRGQITDTFSQLKSRAELRLVQMEDGSEFVTTKNHPFLALRGWVPAEEVEGVSLLTYSGCMDMMLSHGYSAGLSGLRQDELCSERPKVLLPELHGSGEGSLPGSVRTLWEEPSWAEAKSLLFAILSSECSQGWDVGEVGGDLRARQGMARSQPPDSEGCFAENDRGQSHVGSSYSRKDGTDTTEDSTFSESARGERPTFDQTPADAFGVAWRGVGSRVVDPDKDAEGQRIPSSLQGRSSDFALDGSRRGGWSLPPEFSNARTGCEEGADAPTARVARVQIPEQADLERLGICPEGDSGLYRVFNVSVDRHPSYVLSTGKLVVHNCHRIGAKTWSVVPAKFPARWRLGITATPRRKDGAEKVFQYHLGEILFAASEQRMKPKIRRVHTTFQVLKTAGFNPALMNKSILLKFLCSSQLRNRVVAMQVVMALQAGRKVLVLSERLNHLEALHKEIETQWGSVAGPCPSIDYYVGGRKEKELAVASKAQVILATSQYAQEGLDIPALDTLVLSTPLSDVEQAVGRILRPFEGKKDPIVVDIRDDKVGLFRALGTKRDVIYERMT